MIDDDDQDFDLFSDLDADELKRSKVRQSSFNQAKDARMEQLLQQYPSPHDRGIASNRWIYKQLRLHSKTGTNVPTLLPQFLSSGECQHILEQLPNPTSTDWTTARHSAFPTTDIPIATCTPLQYLKPLLQKRLVDAVLAPAYGFGPGQLGFRDMFIVRYDSHAQQGLAPHTDGCLMSFTILINKPDEFEGGGTQFFIIPATTATKTKTTTTAPAPATEEVIMRPTHQGDVVHHDAFIKHQGLDITRGRRIVLVGFVDTIDTIQKDQLAQQGQEPVTIRKRLLS